MELATDLSKTALARPRGSWKGPHRVTEYTGTKLFQATRRIQVPIVASSRAWHFSTGKKFRRNAESPIAAQHFYLILAVRNLHARYHIRWKHRHGKDHQHDNSSDRFGQATSTDVDWEARGQAMVSFQHGIE
jgi:hypothetical protein